ncbi:MAG: hypothetical protein HY268_07120 [Deltaproteobacteria bacterium]|nr:hypothetical protein [Deltaproteobacteria bacterium]
MKKTRPVRPLWVWIGATVLWWGATCRPQQSGAEERMLRVVSSPAGLTVVAQGVGVEEVLREMGKQMGFAVTAKEAVRPTVNVSITDAAPEEVLQQLLRGENYALVYRKAKGKSAQGTERIAKVLLLSPSGAMAANPAAESGRLEQERHQALLQSQAAVTGPAEATQTVRVLAHKEWTRLKDRAKAVARGDPVTLKDLLEDQAFQGMLARSETHAASDSEQPSEQKSGQEPSALTIQRVQRNLAVLVEGVTTATNSLFNSQMNQGQGER